MSQPWDLSSQGRGDYLTGHIGVEFEENPIILDFTYVGMLNIEINSAKSTED